MKSILLLLVAALFTLFSGKPAKNAHVFLELANRNVVVAYQQTGEKGKVSFKHLDEGAYQLVIVFPQQDGKLLREKPKHRTLTKATFNPKNKTYYYQGEEGFFAVKLSNLSKIDKNTFNSVFREVRDEDENKILIARFFVKNKGGDLTLNIEAISASQFKKATDKIGNDVSMMSIPNMY